MAKDGLPTFPEGEKSKLDLLYVPNLIILFDFYTAELFSYIILYVDD
jgi:hypothetical protein